MVYYNEIDASCCVWLQALMDARLIPRGMIDSRSIRDVQPEDLDGFTHCHFFAGIGGWAYAAALAGWPEDRELWTGSCPCQPFSLAGRKLGTRDPRHLWPDFFRLIRARRPAVVMGEQTSAAAGYAWLDGVGADLDGEDYSWRACDIPACAVNAPHIRSRLYWLAYDAKQRLSDWRRASLGEPDGAQPEFERLRGVYRGLQSNGLGFSSGAERRTQAQGRNDVDDRPDAGRQEAPSGSGFSGADDCGLVNTASARCSEAERGESGALRNGAWSEESERRSSATERMGDAGCFGVSGRRIAQDLAGAARTTEGQEEQWQWLRDAACHDGAAGNFWDAYALVGPDPKGKYRRVKPGVRLLAHGIPGRVAQLRGLGNTIVPEEAAEVIRAWMETP